MPQPTREELEIYARRREPMANLDLGGMNLSQINCSGAIFKHCNFRLAQLNTANFDCASLVDCDFTGAVAMSAQFQEAILDGSDLTGADFTGTTLVEASLGQAILDKTKFCDANMEYAFLTSVNALLADFSGANLTR